MSRGKPVRGSLVSGDEFIGLAGGWGGHVPKLTEEWSSVALAPFDAETRFRVRTARGNPSAGLALLDQLDLVLAPGHGAGNTLPPSRRRAAAGP